MGCPGENTKTFLVDVAGIAILWMLTLALALTLSLLLVLALGNESLLLMIRHFLESPFAWQPYKKMKQVMCHDAQA